MEKEKETMTIGEIIAGIIGLIIIGVLIYAWIHDTFIKDKFNVDNERLEVIRQYQQENPREPLTMEEYEEYTELREHYEGLEREALQGGDAYDSKSDEEHERYLEYREKAESEEREALGY